MYYNLSNREAVRSVKLCGRCACGPIVVEQTNENLCYKLTKPINDYVFNWQIAKGTFSSVYLARNLHTDLMYAVKVFSKMDIKARRKVEYFAAERGVLCHLKIKWKETVPFFVELFEAFEDCDNLYLVQSWCLNGPLHNYLKKTIRFPISLAKFYAAEILYALEHLHSLGIIHMALSTENIFLDENMHIKITSFGSSGIVGKWENPDFKKHAKELQKTSSSDAVYYVSPELLAAENSVISRTSDLWAFGSIIYEMISGISPFQCTSEGVVFENRFNLFFYFPVSFQACAKDLVQKLLTPDPSKRLGAKDFYTYTSIRSHPFFADIVYETLYKQTPPRVHETAQGGASGESKVTQKLQPPVHKGQMSFCCSVIKRTCASPEPPLKEYGLGISSFTASDKLGKLIHQRKSLPKWDSLCHGQLILKQGLLDKGKTLFAGKVLFSKKRMILLTLGPHLYIADPLTENITEEIPWGPELHVEHKSHQTFLIHTLCKTYYFRDTKNAALNWCAAIEEVHRYSYQNSDTNYSD